MPKGYDPAYYARNKEKIKESNRKWAKNNPQQVKLFMRRWHYYNAWLSPRAERNRAFGEALRRWRKAAGLSQARLGDVFGVSASIICYAERGEAPKKAEWFKRIPELYETLREVEMRYGA